MPQHPTPSRKSAGTPEHLYRRPPKSHTTRGGAPEHLCRRPLKVAELLRPQQAHHAPHAARLHEGRPLAHCAQRHGADRNRLEGAPARGHAGFVAGRLTRCEHPALLREGPAARCLAHPAGGGWGPRWHGGPHAAAVCAPACAALPCAPCASVTLPSCGVEASGPGRTAPCSSSSRPAGDGAAARL